MVTEPTRRLFTVHDYHRMVEAGILGPRDHVELLDGEIVEVTPSGPRHGGVIAHLLHLFIVRLGDRAAVRPQLPTTLDDLSEPEPDVCVCHPRDDYYKSAHPRPADVLLVIEVSDSSLAYDRGRKLTRYAAVGVQEVWIVDLLHDTIEVYREPTRSGYEQQTVHHSDATVSPRAFPDITLSVRDLLG